MLTPFLPSAISPRRFHALRCPKADYLRFDWMHTRHLPLEPHQFLCWPCEHEVVTVCQTDTWFFFVVNLIL